MIVESYYKVIRNPEAPGLHFLRTSDLGSGFASNEVRTCITTSAVLLTIAGISVLLEDCTATLDPGQA